MAPALDDSVSYSHIREATKLPDINSKPDGRYVGTEVPPSEREDSIFVSLKSSDVKNPNKLYSDSRKNAYNLDLKAKKRNLNYSEVQKGSHLNSQSLLNEESFTSMSNALDHQLNEKKTMQLYIKKLRTIENMPAEQRKSPQLRQILEAYNQASAVSPGKLGYFDRSSKSTLSKHKRIDLMLERYDSALQYDNELQNFIRSSMEKEYMKRKKESKNKN